jgi:transcriptional regulator with XRE-family HTH domain
MKEMLTRQLDEIITASELKNVMLNIGITMRKLRIQRGYKCAEYFAYEYQFNRSAYYGWESGKNISIKKLILVCEALGVSLFDFFSLVKQPRKKKVTVLTQQDFPASVAAETLQQYGKPAVSGIQAAQAGQVTA